MLLRHAKSDWDADFDHDRQRPLNKRGERSARAVGDFLARSGRIPELALTSPAVRAATTLALAASFGLWPTPVHEVSSLYFGGPGDLLDAVKEVSGVSRLLLVGHEPTLSTTVSRLVGGGAFLVPTAGLISFRLTLPDWSAISWGSGELESFVLPRDLLNAGFGA